MNVNICEVCLSVDRKIAEVSGDLYEVYRALIGQNNIKFRSLCWECTAVLNKFVEFKEKAKLAEKIVSNVNLTSPYNILSKLKRTDTLHVICAHDDEESKTEDGRDHTDTRVDVYQHKCDTSQMGAVDDDSSDDESRLLINEVYLPQESDDEQPRSVTPDKKRRKQDGNTRDDRQAGVVHSSSVSKKLRELNVSEELLEMVILSWDEISEERRKLLASDKFTRHLYKCYDCVLGFNHRVKLDEHRKKHQEAWGPCVCDVCLVRCRNPSALSAHRTAHRTRWRCRVCGGCWSRASVAADHVSREHGAPHATHVCAVCRHTHTTLSNLRKHIKYAHSQQHTCELCHKVLHNKTALRQHMFIHKGEREYSCPKCHKEFLFKKGLEIHLLTHASSANLYCHECDMTFKHQLSYNHHLKYNLKHIDPDKLKYACPLCSKRFAHASRLAEHNTAIHLKLTPLRCELAGCDFACASQAVLRTHRRVTHGGAVRRRNHVCDACGKQYTTKKSLSEHLRTHSGERPFSCGACPAAFGYQAALYNHRRLVHHKQPNKRDKPQPSFNSTTTPS